MFSLLFNYTFKMSIGISNIKGDMEGILRLDSAVRYFGLIDTDQNTIMSKMRTGITSLTSNEEEEIFAIDLEKLRQRLQIFDNSLGKVSFMQIKRQKVIQLIFFIENLLILVTCEPTLDALRTSKISNGVKQILKDYVRNSKLS